MAESAGQISRVPEASAPLSWWSVGDGGDALKYLMLERWEEKQQSIQYCCQSAE